MQIEVPILSKFPDVEKNEDTDSYGIIPKTNSSFTLEKIMTLLEVSGVFWTDSNGLLLFFPLWGDVTLRESLGEEFCNLPGPISVSGGQLQKKLKQPILILLFSFFPLEFDIFRHTE